MFQHRPSIWATKAPLVLMLLLILSNCSSTTPSATSPSAPQIQAVVATSILTTGLSRLPIGLVVDGTAINEPEAKVELAFYYLEQSDQTIVAEVSATYYGKGLPAGVYVAYPQFPQAGIWAVDVNVTLPNQPKQQAGRLRLNVIEQAQDPVPSLGSQAIAIQSPTSADTADLSTITSDPDPKPELYQISLDQALANNKPTALLFATPGFCKTATCGPSAMVMQQLAQSYETQANVIHIEVYAYPFSESIQADPVQFSVGMQAWGLASEPWLFIIDSSGKIRARYEGGITREEIEPVISQLLDEETN